MYTRYKIENYEHVADVIGDCSRIQGDFMCKDTADVTEELANLGSDVNQLNTRHPVSCILADVASELIKDLQSKARSASVGDNIAQGSDWHISLICNGIGIAVSNLYNINESLYRKSSWTQDDFLSYARNAYRELSQYKLMYDKQISSILRSVRNLGLSLKFKHYDRAKKQSHNLLRFM